ncbi:SAM-dependent methyltransferase [Kitasatospora cheerisanensis]|uniref:S-adenosyl-L-methionine-dependent methyltransferase n=1 Tax=Kitasatospora cheerisanensis KCTC 2395 TaxID=1348663 RepID=A0A066YN76_9ACTN|nr:SAM-dependent methyltransferase [Kitasatospora cheerisanensis]KDN81364.1 methyltransferase [Kitasatospora cheerisanensis KCTC 2395]
MTNRQPAGPAEPAAERLSPVSRTALAVARVRAYESAQPEPLFTDPYALAFVTAAGAPPRPEDARPGPFARRLLTHGILRTRHYDDRLLAAGARQVVVLAAGLDTRAHRLPWPDGTRLFELDLPPVLAFKDEVLAAHGARPRCARTVLPADLTDPGWPDRLRAAGFDPAQPTAWLAEGLLVYLDAEQAARLLTTVGELSAPGSRLLVEQGRDVTRTPAEEGLTEMTSLWRGGLGPGTADWLDAHGWTTRFTSLGEVAAAHGRPLPAEAGATTSGFLEAVHS